MFIVAAFSIIDLIAVADVETLLGAVPPDRVLNEPRKRPRKAGVELPGVDPPGETFCKHPAGFSHADIDLGPPVPAELRN